MSSSSSSTAGGVASPTDMGFKVKASGRKQGKKGTFKIFEDEPPKSTVVNKAQLDALYDGRSAHPVPVSALKHTTTLKLAPVAMHSSAFKSLTKSLSSNTERKAPVKTSAPTLPGNAWATSTASSTTTTKRTSSSAGHRPPALGGYAADFPNLGQKQDPIIKVPAQAATVISPSTSDHMVRASDGFTVVEYPKHGKEKQASSSERVTVATNMATNKFEALISQDSSQENEKVHIQTSKPENSPPPKASGRGPSSVISAASGTSTKVIAKKEDRLWVTVGSKKSGKVAKTSLKHSTEDTKAHTPHPQQPVEPLAASSPKDTEFPPLAAPIKETKKVSPKTSVVVTTTAQKSRPQQPASPLSVTTKATQIPKDAAFPPLLAVPSDSQNAPSKTGVAKPSKSRRRKRAVPVVAPKTQGRDETATLVKPTCTPVPAQPEVATTGESKATPGIEPHAHVTSSMKADNTPAIAPAISFDEGSIVGGNDIHEQISTHQSEIVPSSEPLNPPALPHEDTHHCQKVDETVASCSGLITETAEYAAPESRMTPFLGADDLDSEAEECDLATSTTEPVTLDEARQYQQVVETSHSPEALIAEDDEDTTMESRMTPQLSSDDDLDADGSLGSYNGLFAEGFEHTVIESAMTLQFGFDDGFDADGIVVSCNGIFAKCIEHSIIQIRVLLQLILDDVFGGNRVTVSYNHIFAPGVEHSVIESRMALHFGFDDSTYEDEEDVEPMDIFTIEDAGNTSSSSGTSTPISHATEDTINTEISSPQLDHGASDSTPPPLNAAEARTNQSFMGTASVADILDSLSRKPSKDDLYTNSQVVEVFAHFSTQERAFADLAPLCDISKPREILKSKILQHKMRLGQTKLVEFLGIIEFENKMATMEAVAAACVEAAKKEKEFGESDAGKKIAEIMRRLG